MAVLVVLIAVTFSFGVLLGVIALISRGIHREDKQGTLLGRAPGWSSQGARLLTGMRTARWSS